MSANIPSTMPMSDLLKSTGYNCPAELQGKTFEEATSGSDTKISTNTAATVDVSAYTEPVEIEPAEGYDATKKVTLTLENIPSEADLEANHAATIDVSTYTEPVEIEPTAGKDGMEKVTVTLENIPQPGGGDVTFYAWYNETVDQTFYTLSSIPQVNDIAYSISGTVSTDNTIYRTSSSVVKELIENGFIAHYSDADYEFTRKSGDDMIFPKSSI